VSEGRVGINKRVADRLYGDGIIDESDYVRAVDHAKRQSMRVEEALIELDIMPEKQLLKFIATLYKTQFVSTARMSKAKLDDRALKLVPRGMAMHFLIYPLVLDRMNDKIIVATPDPDNSQALRELAVAAQVERVVAMVARPEAVVAAIERGYQNDRSRFKRLLQARVAEFEEMLMGDPVPVENRRRAEKRRTGQPDWSHQISPQERRARRMNETGRPVTGEFAPDPVDGPRRGYATGRHDGGTDGRRQTGRGLDLDLEPTAGATDDARYVPRRPDRGTGEPRYARRPTGRGRPATGSGYDYDDGGYPDAPQGEPYYDGPTNPAPPAARRTGDAVPDAHPYQRDDYAPAPGLYGGGAYADDPNYTDAAPRAPEPRRLHAPGGRMSSIFPRPPGLGPSSAPAEQAPVEQDERAIMRSAAYLETLRVLVGLLENDRADLRGHSAFVARLAQNICERISLPQDHINDIVIAGYLHDLGRMGSLHLTPLNVAQSEEHLNLCQKLVRLPQQLTESVGLPERALKTLDCLYERQGGGGLPDGIVGKDIPIGARILSVADSYADLTRNASNEYGRMLTPEEAVDVLQQQAGMVFDLNIIDVLEKSTGGEKIITDLLADRNRVLVADPDPEETMVLQLRLAEQGFDVHVARTVEEAEKALAAREFALVVSEIDLDEPEAGLTLKQTADKMQQKSMSWVFVSSRDDRQTAARALKLGADDFIAKPVSTEILVAKLMQLVERQSQKVAPRGVSGSLAQMGIPEIVQILWHGRKTCALKITHGDESGQIHFENGHIVNALWGGAEGDTAFYRMIALSEEGEFAVDPEFRPEGEPVIRMSPEGLLLEGMRLLDEGAIP
jgi:response regulator RpfG family c-di-GMP phosphodiesterase